MSFSESTLSDTDHSTAVVAEQLKSVALLERLDPEVARRTLAPVLRAEAAFASETLAPLHKWPSMPDRDFDVLTRTPNQVRIRRILDFVQPGDRVFDIGTNYGYLSGVLLRDRHPTRYVGIDIDDRQLASVREMIAHNGLGDTPVHLERCDVYDITSGWMTPHAPDLVLLLEVLEHLAEPERAITTLAGSLDDQACLLFSVPLFGRLEGCWGHKSLFDHARIKTICRRAGLHIHHIEAVHNAWVLVLASRGPATPGRVVRARSAPWPTLDEQLVRTYELTSQPHRQFEASARWTKDLATETLEVRPGALEVQFEALDGGPRPSYAGVCTTVDGLSLLRLELEFDDPEPIDGLYVATYDDKGTQLGAWEWRNDDGSQLPSGRSTFVLRPGRPGGLLKPTRSRTGHARELHVFVRVSAGVRSCFRILRSAVLP